MPKPDARNRRKPNPLILVGAGLELAGVVVLMTLGGWWLDGKAGTRPWLMISGAAVGIIGGLYNLWKQGKRFF